MARDTVRNSTEKKLDRRGFLKTVGGAAATAGLLGTVSGKASAETFRTITVPAGQTKQIRIGSGETIENVLFDMTARGAEARIIARGDDWTIRNVGWLGATDNDSGVPNMISAMGHGVIESCYLANGVSLSNSREGAIGVPASHSGAIYVNRCNIGGWSDNAIYAAGAGRPGEGGGTVHVDSCYFHNNNVAHVRVASDGCTIRNSVLHNTNEVPAYPNGAVTSRGIWDYYGDSAHQVEIVDCDIDITSANTNGGAYAAYASKCSFVVRDSRIKGNLGGSVAQTNVGSDPDLSVPAGVPTSAKAAASGETGTTDSSSSQPDSSADGSKPANTLSVVGTNGDLTEYSFTTSGAIEHSTARNASIDSEDTIDGTTATGALAGGVDSYAFDGEITSFSLSGGGADVYVNGEQVDPDALGLSKTLRISGTSSERTDYSFAVDGDLAFDIPLDGVVNPEDAIDAASATGAVAGGEDAYLFSGSITSFELNGGAADVYVNGQKVDPASLGTAASEPEPTTTATTTETTTTTTDQTTVEATTTVTTEPTTTATTTAETTATETTTQQSPEERLPSVIILDSTSDTTVTRYTFGVSGEIAKSAEFGSINAEDTIENGVATGAIGGGKDAYRFSGQLTQFEVDGSASVTVKHGSN